MTRPSKLGLGRPVDPPAYNRLLAGVAGGIAALVTLSSDVGSITGSLVDVTTTTAFEWPAGRRFKITAAVHIQSTVAGDIPEIRITDTSNVVIPFGRARGPALALANKLYQCTAVAIDSTGVGGSLQWKLRCFRETGTGTLTVSNATINGMILVEDIGPV